MENAGLCADCHSVRLPNGEQAIEFLMTGRRPSGIPVLPPMPPYRLTREEAGAVVAYLPYSFFFSSASWASR